MTFGPRPWLQQHWDWRAAGNFVFGGVGSGLLLAAALVLPLGPARAWSLLAGIVLVALGLLSVWLETGRPLRALHVFFNPFTSWMTREAWTGVALVGATVYAFFYPSAQSELVYGGIALAYAWCQARILKAAKGIPAWREPRLSAFIVATAAAEGAALAAAIAPAFNQQGKLIYGWLAAALLVRAMTWVGYSMKVLPALAAEPRKALESVAPRLLWFGTFGALAAAAAASALPGPYAWPIAALGAAAAILTGWDAKRVIVTRAAFNQGFALPALPVRGAR